MRYTPDQMRFSRPTWGAIEAHQPQASGSMPPGWVLDKIAEHKITGGFKLRVHRQSNVCPRCFQARSVNKRCGCP